MYLVEITLIDFDFDNNAEVTLPVLLTASRDKALRIASDKMEAQKYRPDAIDRAGLHHPEEVHVTVTELPVETDVHEAPELKNLILELKWDVTRHEMIKE